MLFVEKFGGSSLAGVERVRCAARLIADTVRAGHSVAAVLSAQGKTTDALLSTAAHYSRSPSKRELDMLLATGEQASVALMAMTLEEMGLPAVSLTGWQVSARMRHTATRTSAVSRWSACAVSWTRGRSSSSPVFRA